MYTTYYRDRRADSKTYPTHCCYCGKDVFYHEKKHGSGRTSKVFFDALGKPWQRHRCREYLEGRRGSRWQSAVRKRRESEFPPTKEEVGRICQ